MSYKFSLAWGKVGEDAAEVFLENKGFKILKRNFRCKAGEIDIIAKDGKELVFVEVKLKKSEDFGRPAEMVHYYKQKRILKVAQFYMLANDIDPERQSWRVDVVEVWFDSSRTRHFNHLINAVSF